MFGHAKFQLFPEVISVVSPIPKFLSNTSLVSISLASINLGNIEGESL